MYISVNIIHGEDSIMEQLKRELRERYISTYNECKKIKYSPRYFLDMVVSNEDIIEVTRRLIHKEGGTSGFEILYEKNRMDLSVENIILEPRFRVLFSKEDLIVAYQRLKDYGFIGLDKIKKP